MTNSALDDDMLCLQNVLRPMRAVRKMLRTDGHAHLRTVDQKSLAVEQMIGSYIARYDAAAMEGIAGRRRFKGAKRRNDRAVAERHVAASNARRASSRAVERGPEAWAADPPSPEPPPPQDARCALLARCTVARDVFPLTEERNTHGPNTGARSSVSETEQFTCVTTALRRVR